MNRNWRVQHLSSNVRYMVGVNTQPCFAPIVKCFIQIWFFYVCHSYYPILRKFSKVIIGKQHKKYKKMKIELKILKLYLFKKNSMSYHAIG